MILQNEKCKQDLQCDSYSLSLALSLCLALMLDVGCRVYFALLLLGVGFATEVSCFLFCAIASDKNRATLKIQVLVLKGQEC